MPVTEEIAREKSRDMWLDPKNPRLGREFVASKPTQAEILERMSEWALKELAVSFIENGFWTQEALVATTEVYKNRERLVIIEGNRRLAALKMLKAAFKDDKHQWAELIIDVDEKHLKKLWNEIPYVLADNRDEVQSYLGFRHVSGIKEWAPAEKAEFIAHLIDDHQMSYKEVMRRIGSKTNTVRHNYIAYRLLLQMEKHSDDISIEHVEERFSVLYLSLRTEGVKGFLEIDIDAPERQSKEPVPKKHIRNLKNFALWLFGNGETLPIVNDSRQVDKFGNVLESADAVAYLERAEAPSLLVAYRKAGGAEQETIRHIERASDELQEALSTVHMFSKSKPAGKAAEDVFRHAKRLLSSFPAIEKRLLAELKEEEL